MNPSSTYWEILLPALDLYPVVICALTVTGTIAICHLRSACV